ncbi:hypothetical protein FRC01_006513 [Tulasnella sp. 417]|nr:hypothetical protein FRC01_006513 [Tulasnella sp. 417]
MTDYSNARPKVAEFKALYKMTIPNLPTAIPRSTTHPQPYTPHVMPILDTHGPIELLHDPDIPVCLINGLDLFADGLRESQLDDVELTWARQLLKLVIDDDRTTKIGSEVSTFLHFNRIVATPVQYLCQALGLEANYADCSKGYNIGAHYAWFMGEEAIAIFEHKIPLVADLYFPQIVSLAKEKGTLDLSKCSDNAESILSKLIMASIYKGLKYCAVHSLTSFIFIRIVWDYERQRYQARISDVIPLSSSTTPIIAVILALVLQSREENQALEYRSLGVEVPSNVSSEQDVTHTSPSQEGGGYTTDPPTSTQMLDLSSMTVPEYWEARELSEGTLAALLNTTSGISLYWDMKPFSKSIYPLHRREDSSLWAEPLPVEAIPRLVAHSPDDRHFMPPSSPPMVPFVLRLNSAVGQGAVGSVYGGSFYDLSMPIIVKLLSTDHMEHELEIWRRLRDLAGVDVPGLFGAYSIEGKDGCKATGALVQQYAGTSISSFDILSLEQRRELYRIVVKIHEANVEHGDVAPRNVTLNSNGRVMVLDFSHSEFHECGHGNCDELRYLRKKLELPE